jgi:hypothetical protein
MKHRRRRIESACRRVIRERQREPLADHGLGYVELLSRDARPDLVVEELEDDANTCIAWFRLVMCAVRVRIYYHTRYQTHRLRRRTRSWTNRHRLSVPVKLAVSRPVRRFCCLFRLHEPFSPKRLRCPIRIRV